MAQLFDGHPELLAHPHELKFGYLEKWVWPRTDINDVDEQFRMLFELTSLDFIEGGYTKGKHNADRKNFFFVPHVQREVFRAALERVDRPTSRNTLDAYFTSYFNAWLNMRNRIDQAKFVTGFVPMMVTQLSNMDEFWRIYPDGYLISIIRSPLSWYPSFDALRGGKPQYSGIKRGAARWNESTDAMFRERKRNPARVIVLKFDDLIGKTEAAMELICQRIGLAFNQALVTPTFNWEPMASNSIFAATEPGVVTSEPAHRDSLLSEVERDYLTVNCMPRYEAALREIVDAV